MQPDERSSYAEGPTTATLVDPGELFRTVRSHGVTLVRVHGTPPRVDVRS
jgi:hypothetical protein